MTTGPPNAHRSTCSAVLTAVFTYETWFGTDPEHATPHQPAVHGSLDAFVVVHPVAFSQVAPVVAVYRSSRAARSVGSKVAPTMYATYMMHSSAPRHGGEPPVDWGTRHTTTQGREVAIKSGTEWEGAVVLHVAPLVRRPRCEYRSLGEYALHRTINLRACGTDPAQQRRTRNGTRQPSTRAQQSAHLNTRGLASAEPQPCGCHVACGTHGTLLNSHLRSRYNQPSKQAPSTGAIVPKGRFHTEKKNTDAAVTGVPALPWKRRDVKE